MLGPKSKFAWCLFSLELFGMLFFSLLPKKIKSKDRNHQKNWCLIHAEVDKWVIKLETGTKFAVRG